MDSGNVSETVGEIWRSIFGVDSLSGENDFFQLGGDSLKAIDMILEVERRTGRRIPIGTLYGASTLDRFAAAVDGIEADDKTPMVTPLNQKGSSRPLFLIAPAIGGVFHYREFWQYLGDKQQSYCLEPRISTRGEHSYASVEEMAGCLVKRMQVVQPEGPYRLCGYSFGGSLAWEMARQLTQAGESTECLIAFDSIVRGRESFQPKAREDLRFWLSQLITAWQDHRANGQWLNAGNILRQVMRKIAFKLRGGRNGGIPPGIAEAEGAGEVENRVQEDLRARYDYGTWEGELIFMRAREQLTLHRELTYDLGWKGRPLRGLRIIPVPGNHLKIMSPPASIEIAGKVARILEELDQNGTPEPVHRVAAPARPQVSFPAGTIGTVLAQFYRVLDTIGDHAAIFDEGETVTYHQLNRRAGVIADALAGESAGVEGLYIFLPTTHWMIAAFLGTFKAGSFYVPIDPEHPDSRIRLIVSDTDGRLIITSRRLASRLGAIFGERSFTPVYIEDLDFSNPADDRRNPASPADLAAILYTSGSTGRPKGVVHTQKSVSYVAWRRGAGIGLNSADRYLMVYSGAFMGALNAIYGGLLYGACLYIYNLRRSGVTQMAPWLNAHRITIFHAVTSIYRQFIGSLGPDDRFPHIRCVTPGGEPSRMSDIKQFRKHFESGTVYYANLGSSECGSICFDPICHDTAVHPDLPVGIPFPTLEVRILDPDGNMLPPGEIGQIGICSDSIFQQYWRDPDRTTAALRPLEDGRHLFLTGDYGYLLADGRLVNKGREDGQVKINGYRVEIREVESALLAIDGVRETAVVARPDETGNLRLAAFVRTDPRPGGREFPFIRHRLLDSLPRPMIPTAYHRVARFPLKDNGKLDRRILAELPLDQMAFLLPD